MKKNTKNISYSEPLDFFPKELRKKHGLGEFAEKKTATKTAAPKKKVKRK